MSDQVPQASAAPTSASIASPPGHVPGLQPLLAGLSLLTLLATLRTVLLPPWPRATPLPPEASLRASLNKAGLEARPLPAQPAVQQADRVLGESMVWQLGTGETLQLRHGAMRRWEDIQLAGLTRGLPELALQQRQLRNSGGGPLAIGSVRSGQARQTCLVPGIAATQPLGVTYVQLTGLLSQRTIPLGPRLANLLGWWQPQRYDCVLISLQGRGGQPPRADTWDRLLAGLVPILRETRTGSPNL